MPLDSPWSADEVLSLEVIQWAAARAGVGGAKGGGAEADPTQRCWAEVKMRKNLIKMSQIN